jgi:hypothetical protein
MAKQRRQPAAPSKAAAIVTPAISNAGTLPTANSVYRVMPTQQPWSSRSMELIMKTRDRVQISRFLQDAIPQLAYCIQSLPREAIGRGIGIKSISKNPEFRKAATAYFRTWADSQAVDIRKGGSFYDLQPLWISAVLGDGEAFVQKVSADLPEAMKWRLQDKSRRRLQLQTFLRDQLTNGTVTTAEAKTSRWMDGLKFNNYDQLELVRVNQDPDAYNPKNFTDLSPQVVFHIVQKIRFNQYHGLPWIFRSNVDLLDILDLKAIRKHSAKVRAALLGATTTRDGAMPNSMQQVLAGTTTGTPATDTGRRFVELADGAVMIPLADGETMNFFQGGEAIPFSTILEQILNPFVYGLGYPVEWIFGMGSLGGTAFRGLIEKVKRAHANLRQILYPFLQWSWEWVIADAMMPEGALSKFAGVEDWNDIDFVADPDPSVDLGRDHKADMERIDNNLMTVEDYVESRTGGSGEDIRRASIDEKLDDIQYAIQRGKEKGVPAAVAVLLAIPSRKLQAASGIVQQLTPESLAADLENLSASSGN